jgi:tetratricopeptide (TPR) repeat protein
VGLAWEGRDNEAIGAFNNAISLAPQYANAYYERANSQYAVGNYAQAAADYEAAIAAGRDDTNALWNLGWTYYLLGQFDNAVRINQHALAVDPTLIAVRMNQGAALLAQGRIENAITEYDLALNEAVRQVAEARARGEQPPASLWYYMDAGAADLQSLLDEAGGAPRAWTQSPPASAIIVDRTALETNARQLIVRIKETAVALEFSGAAPGPRGGAAASEFQFVQEVYDANGNFVEYRDSAVNEYGINQIGILFDYSGFITGAREVWKVYVNGYEDPALRVVGELALTGGGSGIKRISYAFSKIFVFAPGEYTVELYIDHHLIRSGTFIVENP